MVTSDTARASDESSRTPVGIVLLCLLLVVYGLLWVVTAAFGTGVLAALAPVVAAGSFLLAALLYAGSAVGWWLGVAFIGASTAWRLALLARGGSENLSNALVGLVLLAYLLGKRGFYRDRSEG